VDSHPPTDRRESGAHRREQVHLHWWLSQEPYVLSASSSPPSSYLYDPVSAGARMAALEADAPLYRASTNPTTPLGTRRKRDPARASGIVGLWRRSACPTLADAAPCSPDTAASLRSIVQALETIVRFHFQFTAIAQQSSSGGVSEMYAKYAREVANAADATSRRRASERFAMRSPRGCQRLGPSCQGSPNALC